MTEMTHRAGHFPGSGKHLQIVLAFFLAVALGCGCAFFRKPAPVMCPVPERTGNLRIDLLNRANSIRSLDIRGRLKIAGRDRKFPSFNARIWFFSSGDDLLLRIRGSGPLGVTVFDLLADRDEAWIYLPSQNRILRGNTFFTSHGSIGVETAIRLMEICLNPWVPAGHCQFPEKLEKTEGGEIIARLGCRLLGRNLVVRYRLSSLMPVSIESNLANITFSTSSPQEQYPDRISFHLKKDGIEGSLSVRQVKFNTLSPDSTVFEKALFSPRAFMPGGPTCPCPACEACFHSGQPSSLPSPF